MSQVPAGEPHSDADSNASTVRHPLRAVVPAPEAPKLTSLSAGGGCGCKLSPQHLERILAALPPRRSDPGDLLVGHESSDDAAVYRLGAQTVVFTTDFFTPVVDDPFAWGQIAATNALSDIYAMGGQPVVALNLVAWPREGLSLDLLGEVLRGGAEAVAAAGAVIAGGHSIDDERPKYGLAVLGLVDERELIRNDGGRAGDLLILTKPLGLGVISTAIKNDLAPAPLIDKAIGLMTHLNAGASEVARKRGIHGGTDVTGFGLLGHLHELALASGLAAEIELIRVPIIDGVPQLMLRGMTPSGTRRNHASLAKWIDWDDLDDNEQHLLVDAQTSGGMLLAVAPEHADAVIGDLQRAGTPAAAIVGRLAEGVAGEIAVRRG